MKSLSEGAPAMKGSFHVGCVASLIVSVLFVSFSLNLTRTANDVDVGVYYYVWYGPDNHWNETPSSHVRDRPVWGYYDSGDVDVIRNQLDLVVAAKVDWLIISWWNLTETKNNITDANARIVFSVIHNYSYPLEACILIEPFNETNSYDWVGLYGYIYDTYVSQCPFYHRLNGKPLLLIMETCFDNSIANNPSDSRFTIRIVGSHMTADYYYGDVEDRIDKGDVGEWMLTRDGVVTVFPRYDEQLLNRPNPKSIDPTYSEGLYDKLWAQAFEFEKQGVLRTVLLLTWNEYHERTQIEPNTDATSFSYDSYYVYKKTKDYIGRLKGFAEAGISVEFALLMVGLVAAAAVVVYVVLRGKMVWRKTGH